MIRRHAVLRSSLLSALALTGACASDKPTGPVVSSYLHGTASNHQIGIVVNSTGHAVTLFQLGAPTNTKQVALGASNAITPVGLSVRGESAIVPLGDASSVALIDLNTLTITRFFLFAAGNTTGQAFVDDTTVFADNSDSAYVGRFTTGQASDTIRDTVHVAPSPTDIEVSGSRVLVISANLNASFLPNGNGIVTAIDAHSLTVLDTVSTGGTNSTAGAIGPDGNLYVVNTGDFVNPGSMTVIQPRHARGHPDRPKRRRGPGRDRHRQPRARVHLELQRRHGYLEYQYAGIRPWSEQSAVRADQRRRLPRRSMRAPTRRVTCTRSSSQSEPEPQSVRIRLSRRHLCPHRQHQCRPGPSALRIAEF